ncbi:hypothetical protein [Actinoallomurus sp. CA-150999]|uniref:hypothetical protein n=1 Tax=Actinoallomurus sp. CA-150999 TaxID=3239887 RepID=UPI003D93A483
MSASRTALRVGLVTAAAAAASALACPANATVPAAAASGTVHTMERGVSGCIAWSYSYGYAYSANVYYHNRCKAAHYLKLDLRGRRDKCFKVAGHKKSKVYVAPVPIVLPSTQPTIRSVKQVTHC